MSFALAALRKTCGAGGGAKTAATVARRERPGVLGGAAQAGASPLLFSLLPLVTRLLALLLLSFAPLCSSLPLLLPRWLLGPFFPP